MYCENLLNKYRMYLVPNTWWKLKDKSHYRYRKIVSIETINNNMVLKLKDSNISCLYRMDWFLQNHIPVTSKLEKAFAKLNHLTRGFIY